MKSARWLNAKWAARPVLDSASDGCVPGTTRPAPTSSWRVTRKGTSDSARRRYSVPRRNR